MKKLLTILSICTVAGLFAQTEEVHDAVITGSFDLGDKQVSFILDEFTGCTHKTNPHEKDILRRNERVKIDIDENANLGEVIKPDLPERVFVNVNCDGNAKNPHEIEGIIHNLIVKEIYSDPDLLNMDDCEINQKIELLYDQLRQEMGLSAEAHVNCQTLQTEFNAMIDDPVEYNNNLLKKFSSKVQKGLNDVDDLLSKSKNIDDFNRGIDVLTVNFVQRNDLKAEEKYVLLGSLAICKHSFQFWNELGFVNPGDPEPQEGPVWADIKGFVIGIFFGRPRAMAVGASLRAKIRKQREE